jgi:hypothetical protein
VQLAEFAGAYRSAEAEADYATAVEDGRLVLRRRPDTRRELTPVYADAFTTPDGALIRFIRGADGRVQAFTVSIDRVRGLRFDRVGG